MHGDHFDPGLGPGLEIQIVRDTHFKATAEEHTRPLRTLKEYLLGHQGHVIGAPGVLGEFQPWLGLESWHGENLITCNNSPVITNTHGSTSYQLKLTCRFVKQLCPFDRMS